ncbi:MAG: hypothetical protein ACI9CF_000973 [Candidatus Omnitrophota bacterium]
MRKFQVVSTQGQVYIINEDQAEELALGSEIKPADSIKVSPKSSISLIMDNNKENIVRIRPSSDLHFKSTKPVEIEMLYGDIFSKLHALRKGEKCSAQPPLGVASVRGSIFQVEHRDQTLVSNFDKSLVTFESFDAEFNVSDNVEITQFLSISKENIASEPTQSQRISLQKLVLAEGISSHSNLTEIQHPIQIASISMVVKRLIKIYSISLLSVNTIHYPHKSLKDYFNQPCHSKSIQPQYKSRGTRHGS